MSVEIPASFYENATVAGAAPNGAAAGAADVNSIYAPPAPAGIDGNTPTADTGSIFTEAAGDSSYGHAEAEELRRKHLRHEGSIRALGGIYYLLAMLYCFVGLSGLLKFLSGATASSFASSPIPGLGFIAVGLFVFATGRALRRLNPSAYTPTLFISAIGLFGFPLGTLFSAAVLIQLNSKLSKFVLSPDYSEIVARTPQIKAATSGAVKFLLAVVALVFVALVVVIWVIGSR